MVAAGMIYGLIGGPRAFLHTIALPESSGWFVDAGSANAPGGIIAQLSGGYVAGPIYGLIYAGIYGSAAAIIGALAYGGYACLSHLALRLVLWRQGAIPWNYAAFLDHCVGRVFLRRVGGGYIFVHRLLLEYFATLPEAEASAPRSAAPAPQPTAEGATSK